MVEEGGGGEGEGGVDEGGDERDVFSVQSAACQRTSLDAQWFGQGRKCERLGGVGPLA